MIPFIRKQAIPYGWMTRKSMITMCFAKKGVPVVQKNKLRFALFTNHVIINFRIHLSFLSKTDQTDTYTPMQIMLSPGHYAVVTFSPLLPSPFL